MAWLLLLLLYLLFSVLCVTVIIAAAVGVYLLIAVVDSVMLFAAVVVLLVDSCHDFPCLMLCGIESTRPLQRKQRLQGVSVSCCFLGFKKS